MNKPTIYITVLGWEDRFILGLQRMVKLRKLDLIYLYTYNAFNHLTGTTRTEIYEYAESEAIPIREFELDYDSTASTWRALQDSISQNEFENATVIVDISTMPREIVWNIIFFVLSKTKSIHYVYHKPSKYSSWLTRDPSKPRLIYKHSGIFSIEKKTALLIVTGFDAQRTQQLVSTFQPDSVHLAIQKGSQYDNHLRNIHLHTKDTFNSDRIHRFEIDVYSTDHGTNLLVQRTQQLLIDYNVIASSLGPKLSAIALYRVWLRYPEIALAYTPSKEYNESYSTGIGESIFNPIFET